MSKKTLMIGGTLALIAVLTGLVYSNYSSVQISTLSSPEPVTGSQKEGPINNWTDAARAGYQFQKGEIAYEDIWLPNGSSSVVAAAEHGYYAGIIMACAEGYGDDTCQEAEDYAKKYSLNMDVEPNENEGGYY